jgi:hypothetical protein
MFDHQCTSCGKHQLIFPSQVTSVTNNEAGIVVRFSCWCGSAQTWVTGRRRTPLAAATAA